ncbi:ATP-dependent exoDNAse [Phanerochaete sordida]|uniref:ATP-dependent DNA helicase n=1 Tax=Phanerochaete sordida TaxID=48140 RepID=A0A9P3GSP5_9APHY|nr:ATP-dependent exoDNAse [Phanerochaete sordida]
MRFPNRNDPASSAFYSASVLTLLKPWRHLETDLKTANETWEQALDRFLTTSDNETALRRIMGGLQYFHDCLTAAREAGEDDLPEDDYAGAGDGEELEDAPAVSAGDDMSEEGLAAFIRANEIVLRERIYAQNGLNLARAANVFPSSATNTWDVHDAQAVRRADAQSIARMEEWDRQLQEDVQEMNRGREMQQTVEHQPEGTDAGVERIREDDQPQRQHEGEEEQPGVEPMFTEDALRAADPAELEDEQFCAYDIIRWHLGQTLAEQDPPPLRMILYGEGGTGKSKVIQTVTEEFKRQDCAFMLVKAAYTGMAASLIDGKTLHVIGSVGIRDPSNISPETLAKLQAFWKHARYLVIDEYSMISKSFMAVLSKNIDIGRQGAEGHKPGEPFGGVNVILCGDLHQFKPVVCQKGDALFAPASQEQTTDAKVGGELYRSFKLVVILRKQRRVTDPVWRDLLVHLRAGKMKEEHVETLESLVLRPQQTDIDFEEDAAWSQASLVTPRHGVRKLWNDASVRKHCAKTGETLFICPAEDRVKERGRRARPLTLVERYAVAGRLKTKKKQGERGRKDLPWTVELARGMKVLVTNNIETDLDLANGSRGEIVDIILHPDEPEWGTASTVHLKHMPRCILVRMDRTRASQLAGLPPGVIPVQPMESTMQIRLKRNGKTVQRTVRRRQFPVTGAYAFTDYRAQGQTLRYVLVDIATPPSFELTLTNMYVALSRSPGRDTIRLLRPFDRAIFLRRLDPDLETEDERLERLDGETRAWWKAMGGEVRLAECRANAEARRQG